MTKYKTLPRSPSKPKKPKKPKAAAKPVGKPPLEIATEALIPAIEKYNGNVGDMAKGLGISRRWLTYRIQGDEELCKINNDVRKQYLDERLDLAEEVVTLCLKQRDDLNVALKAAIFFLNNMGRSRGYCHPVEGHIGDRAKLAIEETATQMQKAYDTMEKVTA